MKVCEINDCEWWIGESLEACVKDYREHAEAWPEYYEDARELTEEELDRLHFTETDENEVPTGIKRTFREQLAIEIAAGGTFPRMFATTEY